MITFRGKEEEQRIVTLAKMLSLDKSEVLRRAVNHYYGPDESEFKAYDWLHKRLGVLPGSGRHDISRKRGSMLV